MAYLCDFWQCWYVVSTYQPVYSPTLITVAAAWRFQLTLLLLASWVVCGFFLGRENLLPCVSRNNLLSFTCSRYPLVVWFSLCQQGCEVSKSIWFRTSKVCTCFIVAIFFKNGKNASAILTLSFKYVVKKFSIISPEPNGQGYNQTCCWFDIFFSNQKEMQIVSHLSFKIFVEIISFNCWGRWWLTWKWLKLAGFFWFNEKYSNQ